MFFTSSNPATETEFAKHRALDTKDVFDTVSRANDGQKIWGRRPLEERAEILRRLANILERDITDVATLITHEMGKPITQSIAEVQKCAVVCRYMADAALHVLAPELQAIDGATATITYEPLGVILAIMPWNFPLWQFFRFAAPALIAGNSILVKHAPSTWGSAVKAVAMCHEAGVPIEVVQCLLVEVHRVEAVIIDPRVHAVTFTGSTAGGLAVAEAAGRALKKCVLELGGNDAYIVCNDANLDVAVDACVASRCNNSGQSCIAAKRFLVHESVIEEFASRVAKRFDALVVGDPMDPATEIGPLATKDLRNNLLDQILDALDKGAYLSTKRQINETPEIGHYLCPVLLSGVSLDSRLFTEETFGIAIGVFPFSTDEEAVKLANNSQYGLGAAVFSADESRAKQIAARIDCGMVAINDYVRSDVRLPFGGKKMSGYGRELGVAGMREFVNIKVIHG